MNDTAHYDNTAPPERVTRFYGNPDYALETIASKQIAFVHVSTLNDPFDPHFFLEIEFGDSYQKLHDYIKNNHPTTLQWFKHHVTPVSWSQTIEQLKDKLNSFRQESFVFSTSGLQDGTHPKDNLYMWGHYGNGHRGVAIEFDTNELKKAAIEQTVNKPGVNYHEAWVNMHIAKNFFR